MFPTLLAALALSAPVPKPAPIDLSWKFTKGDVFYVTHEERCGSTTRAARMDHRSKSPSSTFVVYKLTVTASGRQERRCWSSTFVERQARSGDDAKNGTRTLTIWRGQ